MVTIMGAVLRTVATAVAVFVGSLTEVTVRVTVFPGGIVLGAENVAGAPLAVCIVIEPQAELPQVRVQVTPPLSGSFSTVAVTLALLAVPEVAT